MRSVAFEISLAYVIMAYIVMAYIVMACMVYTDMAYIIMAYIVMARWSSKYRYQQHFWHRQVWRPLRPAQPSPACSTYPIAQSKRGNSVGNSPQRLAPLQAAFAERLVVQLCQYRPTKASTYCICCCLAFDLHTPLQHTSRPNFRRVALHCPRSTCHPGTQAACTEKRLLQAASPWKI